ncbi:UNVERIFIED_CONTAM: hypothetical protein GTU68_036669, partial [Idotea baltica]|nr:hypothetical protein [Idotea baltica]
MLADNFNTLQMGMVAAERVFVELDREEHIANYGEKNPEKINGKVEFRDVHFSYDGENDVLKGVNFVLDAHKTLAIVGSTGSGKTTIINVLARFYELRNGKVLIDDQDIKTMDLEFLRKSMAVVLQDVFLFNGTVFENITLRDPSISLETVKEASQIIGADRYIDEMSDGYNHVITERGGNLSMGQRQLISFVRA